MIQPLTEMSKGKAVP